MKWDVGSMKSEVPKTDFVVAQRGRFELPRAGRLTSFQDWRRGPCLATSALLAQVARPSFALRAPDAWLPLHICCDSILHLFLILVSADESLLTKTNGAGLRQITIINRKKIHSLHYCRGGSDILRESARRQSHHINHVGVAQPGRAPDS